METLRLCTQCLEPLPTGATERLCVKCQSDPGRTTPMTGGPVLQRPPPPHPAEIAQHFPQLEILEVIGHGGMGMVYKARQPQLNRFVALKILSPNLSGDPAFAERFTREAQSLARLHHSGVVSVYDFGQSGGFYYFLMEYVDGESLHTLIHEDKPALEEIRRIVLEICGALQYAHEEGVIHRDIKPSNILLDKKGRVKIADFGLARLAGNNGGNPGLTTVVMGTPHYMAPEQIETPTAVDHRADIYSLGVVFYEMLTGQLPLGRFELPSQKSPGLGNRFDKVVLRALETNPGARYQNAAEMRADLENATGAGAGSRLKRWGPWRQAAVMAGTAALAVLCYAGASKHWFRKRFPHKPPPAPMTATAPAALDDMPRGGRGANGAEPGLIGQRIVNTLQLTKAQAQDVTRVIRSYQREYVSLEKDHTTHTKDKAGHVHITISPFPDDVHQLMARFWNELGGLLTTQQITRAQTLNFERFFPNTGLATVRLEIWRDPNGEEHFVETQDPGGKPGAPLKTGRPMPPRYRLYLPDN